VLVADEVDAGDLDAHAVGRVDAGGLAVEVLRGDEGRRQHAVAHAVLVAVGVVEERLERPTRCCTPFSMRDHSS
jgi:hypothetical protein